jgi:hypothetical protein
LFSSQEIRQKPCKARHVLDSIKGFREKVRAIVPVSHNDINNLLRYQELLEIIVKEVP